MTDDAQPVTYPHRRRRRKSHRKFRRRLFLVALTVAFLLAWGYAVMRLTKFLGQKEELGQKYHDIDPAGFDSSKTAGGSQ